VSLCVQRGVCEVATATSVDRCSVVATLAPAPLLILYHHYMREIGREHGASILGWPLNKQADSISSSGIGAERLLMHIYISCVCMYMATVITGCNIPQEQCMMMMHAVSV
jgi:hypothetical protein